MANTRAQKTAQNLSTLTTAGDMAYASAAGTPARLGIGSTDQVLKVSNGIPAWAAASSGTAAFVGAQAYNSTSQSISNASYVTMLFDSHGIDTNSFHSTSSNTGRFTIPASLAGKYQLNAQLHWGANGTYVNGSKLNVNGSTYAYPIWTTANSVGSVQNWTFILALSVADYVEWQVYQQQGGAVNALGNNNPTERCLYTITYLGA